MDEDTIYKVIDIIRETDTHDNLIRDRLLNYLEANIDEFIECYEESEARQ